MTAGLPASARNGAIDSAPVPVEESAQVPEGCGVDRSDPGKL